MLLDHSHSVAERVGNVIHSPARTKPEIDRRVAETMADFLSGKVLWLSSIASNLCQSPVAEVGRLVPFQKT